MRSLRGTVLVLSWLLLWSVGTAAPAPDLAGTDDRPAPPAANSPAPALVAELNAESGNDVPAFDALTPCDAPWRTPRARIAPTVAAGATPRGLFDRRAATLVGIVVLLD